MLKPVHSRAAGLIVAFGFSVATLGVDRGNRRAPDGELAIGPSFWVA